MTDGAVDHPAAGPVGVVRRRLVADPRHGPLPGLLLVLTVVTGVVDAVSILRMDRVFVANMTGNVVFVGFGVAGASGFSPAASAVALAGFAAGALADPGRGAAGGGRGGGAAGGVGRRRVGGLRPPPYRRVTVPPSASTTTVEPSG